MSIKRFATTSARLRNSHASSCLAPVLTLMIVLFCNDRAAADLRYTVRFDDAARHYIDISLNLDSTDLDSESVTLMLPVWTPGSYLVREYARNLQQLTATGRDGRLLTATKTSKNRWLVRHEPGEPVEIRYRLYCREMSVRTNWVDADLAVLNAAATFLTVPTARNQPHRITLELPDHWRTSLTALPAVDGIAQTWQAATYDELIDSPIVAGNPVVHEFTSGGADHQFASFGDTALWDLSQAATDVQQIVDEHQRMWGHVPYPQYLFLNLVTESGGGLEHDLCTLIMTSRFSFRDEDKYQDWLSLVSHEFFHTWNVRRLRPVGLAVYDLESENYTSSLWIAEGITSYYQDLALVRAGLIDQKTYLKRLSRQIERLQETPGRRIQSLTDASLDAWIKYYRPDENSVNSRISYYTKGAVVAFLLDAEIRQRTAGRRSLDDVMRQMYETFADADGYTEAQFRQLAADVAGSDLSDWFAVHVDAAEDLDYAPALNWYGLKFAETDKASVDAETSANQSSSDTSDQQAESGDDADEPQQWLGISVRDSSGRAVISRVLRDSPASHAGFNVDDEILAFAEYRVTESDWEQRLQQFPVDEQLSVLVSRRGRLRRLDVVVGREPEQQWKLQPVEDPTDDQTTQLQHWLQVSAEADDESTAPSAD